MSTENKELTLYGFKDLDMQVKKLEMVELSLREDIDTYMYMLEDKKENSSAEDVRFIMLDLLTAI
ncbi:hypothetical protein [Sulfurimonas sp.]